MSDNSFYDVSWQEDFFVFKANGKCYCILCEIVFPGNTKRIDVMIHCYTRHVYVDIMSRHAEKRKKLVCSLKGLRKMKIISKCSPIPFTCMKHHLIIIVGTIFEDFENPKIMEELKALGLSKDIILRGIEYCETDVSTSLRMCSNALEVRQAECQTIGRVNCYISLLLSITFDVFKTE